MLDLQIIVNYIVGTMTLITPIIVIFIIVEKTTNFFYDFVNGNRRVKL